jgi:hypothetical protein
MKTQKYPMAALRDCFKSGDLTAANDQSLFYPRFEGNGSGESHGSIFAANDANFDAQYLNEPLQEFIMGAPEDEGIEVVLNQLMPVIPVGRAFSYRTHDTREQFQDDADSDQDIREIEGDFAKIRRTGAQVQGRVQNKGLTMVLDNDQGGEDTEVQRRAVLNLRVRLLRSELRRGLTAIDTNAAITNSENWGPSNAGKPDPDYSILKDVDAGGDARGLDGNLVVEGGTARIYRIGCLRSSVNPAISMTANLNARDRSDLYGVDNICTVRNRRQISATTKGKILGAVVYSLYSRPNAMPDDASNVKRFVSSTPQGILRVYLQPILKRTLVSVEHYSFTSCTSPLGITKRTVTFT